MAKPPACALGALVSLCGARHDRRPPSRRSLEAHERWLSGWGRGLTGVLCLSAGLHSSAVTINSVESLFRPGFKGTVTQPNRPAEQLEYSSALLQKTQLPRLTNCVINSHAVNIGKRLGGGLFGDTYVGEYKDRCVALKRFTVGVHQNQLNEEVYGWLRREISYLSRLRHKNLIALLGIVLDLRQPHIVNEYVNTTSLRDLLKRQFHHYSLHRKVKFLIQAAEGMHHLHSAKTPVLHRDLRAANLLVDGEDRVKIADYGVTKLIQRLRLECNGREGCYCQKHQSALPASIRWTAPEVLLNPNAMEGNPEVFSCAVDVYSFAMVMWEAATGQDPYQAFTDEQEIKTIVIEGGRPDPDVLAEMGVVPHYRELMKVCWDSEPEYRPLFKHVIMHLKTVLHVSQKSEKAARSRGDDSTSYLKSALSLHIDS